MPNLNRVRQEIIERITVHSSTRQGIALEEFMNMHQMGDWDTFERRDLAAIFRFLSRLALHLEAMP